MDEVNRSIRDYYLLPWLEAGRTPSLRLAPENGILLDAYRFDTLDAFVELTKRVPLQDDDVTEDEPEIRSIPVDHITVLNPRVRNKRIFQELVDSIAHLGLKKPITVCKRPGRTRYDLVCGQGRLEAFIALGQTEIPALVVEASEEDGYIMSLVGSPARRQHSPLELVHAIGALAGRGYSHAEIAKKVDFSVEYVTAISSPRARLGEAQLRVERGVIPHVHRDGYCPRQGRRGATGLAQGDEEGDSRQPGARDPAIVEQRDDVGSDCTRAADGTPRR